MNDATTQARYIFETIIKLLDQGVPSSMVLDENSPTLDAIRDWLEDDAAALTRPDSAAPAGVEALHVRTETLAKLKEWEIDGTLVLRAAGALSDQEKRIIELEKALAAAPKAPNADQDTQPLGDAHAPSSEERPAECSSTITPPVTCEWTNCLHRTGPGECEHCPAKAAPKAPAAAQETLEDAAIVCERRDEFGHTHKGVAVALRRLKDVLLDADAPYNAAAAEALADLDAALAPQPPSAPKADERGSAEPAYDDNPDGIVNGEVRGPRMDRDTGQWEDTADEPTDCTRCGKQEGLPVSMPGYKPMHCMACGFDWAPTTAPARDGSEPRLREALEVIADALADNNVSTAQMIAKTALATTEQRDDEEATTQRKLAMLKRAKDAAVDRAARRAYDNTFHKIKATIGYDDWLKVWRMAVEWYSGPIETEQRAEPQGLTEYDWREIYTEANRSRSFFAFMHNLPAILAARASAGRAKPCA